MGVVVEACRRAYASPSACAELLSATRATRPEMTAHPRILARADAIRDMRNGGSSPSQQPRGEIAASTQADGGNPPVSNACVAADESAATPAIATLPEIPACTER